METVSVNGKTFKVPKGYEKRKKEYIAWLERSEEKRKQMVMYV
jgi:hypothetical protein